MTLACYLSPGNPATLFVNALAGRGRPSAVLGSIRQLFAARRVPLEVILPDSQAEMESRVTEVLCRGRRLLLVLGGDGTLHTAVNAAAASGKLRETMFGIFPAGGGNDFANALGVPIDAVLAARRLLESAHRQLIDLAEVHAANGRTRVYLGGGGLGLDAEAARYAANHYRDWRPRFRYPAAALHAYRHFQPILLRAEFPGTEKPAFVRKALLAAVLNTSAYGAGLRLAPEAAITDGWLDLVVVHDLHSWQVLGVLARLALHRPLAPAHTSAFRVEQVRLSADRECFFHGDGEWIGPGPVAISVLPKALSVLLPATNFSSGY